MTNSKVTCRLATPDDAETIHRFIYELAEFEKGEQHVMSTPEILRRHMLSEKPPFECLIAEAEGKPCGFALFFQSYSTWEAKAGLYLEDLYVTPDARKFGAGRALIDGLREIARQRDYARMDWKVLDWNTLARDFYSRIGAEAQSDWIPYRLVV